MVQVPPSLRSGVDFMGHAKKLSSEVEDTVEVLPSLRSRVDSLGNAKKLSSEVEATVVVPPLSRRAVLAVVLAVVLVVASVAMVSPWPRELSWVAWRDLHLVNSNMCCVHGAHFTMPRQHAVLRYGEVACHESVNLYRLQIWTCLAFA